MDAKNQNSQDVLNSAQPLVETEATATMEQNQVESLKKLIQKKEINFTRSFNYKLDEDPINYYREQLMHFLPWNEQDALVWVNASLDELKAIYAENEEKIKAARDQSSANEQFPKKDEDKEKDEKEKETKEKIKAVLDQSFANEQFPKEDKDKEKDEKKKETEEKIKAAFNQSPAKEIIPKEDENKEKDEKEKEKKEKEKETKEKEEK